MIAETMGPYKLNTMKDRSCSFTLMRIQQELSVTKNAQLSPISLSLILLSSKWLSSWKD